MAVATYYGTGKRKTSIARVWLGPGDGKIVVNGKTVDNYFGRETCRMLIRQPLQLTNMAGKFNITVSVYGGGSSSQADAIKYGVAKALSGVSSEFRDTLKRQGFLTRDSRIKERKKYGQKGARGRFQFSKR